MATYANSGGFLVCTGTNCTFEGAYDASVAGGWGYDSSKTAGTITFSATCKIQMGNSSTGTTFVNDTAIRDVVFLAANTDRITVTANATVTLSNYSFTSGAAATNTNALFLMNGGTATLTNCRFFNSIVGGGRGFFANTGTTAATLARCMFNNFYIAVTNAAGTISYSDLIIDGNVQGMTINSAASVMDVAISNELSSALYALALNSSVTVSNINISNYTNHLRTNSASNQTNNLINCDANFSSISFAGGGTHTINRKVTFDSIQRRENTVLDGVLNTLWDKDKAANDFSVLSAGGVGIAQQTVTVGTKVGAAAYVEYPNKTLILSKSGYLTQNDTAAHTGIDIVISGNLFTSGVASRAEMKQIGDEQDPTFDDTLTTVADNGDDRVRIDLVAGTSNCGVAGVEYQVFMRKDEAPTLTATYFIGQFDKATIYVLNDADGTALASGTWHTLVRAIDKVGNTTGGVTDKTVAFTRAEVALPGQVTNFQIDALVPGRVSGFAAA